MMPAGLTHAVPLAACTPVYGYPDVLTHPVYPVGPIQAPAAAADPIQQVQPAQDQQEVRREDLFQGSKNLAMKLSSRSRFNAKVGTLYLVGLICT
jgi:hypothetical protein